MVLKRYQNVFALAAVIALLAAPVIGFSHATIPHTHTHTSDNALHAAIEHGLDSSLSRKEAVVPFVLCVLFVVALIVLRSRTISLAYIHEAPLLSALRRGVLAYRRFS